MEFITVNHLEEFGGLTRIRTGDKLILKKDPCNCYDDEAIAVYTVNGSKCGYVANSVHSVARGTNSAGRIYDKIKDDAECMVRFMTDEIIICQLTERK